MKTFISEGSAACLLSETTRSGRINLKGFFCSLFETCNEKHKMYPGASNYAIH